MSIFEALMLISFGLAWPSSIYKSIKSKSTLGKSAAFTVIVLIGYICGILNKIFYRFDYVIILYIINLIMISVDLCLYFRNLKLEKANANFSTETLNINN